MNDAAVPFLVAAIWLALANSLAADEAKPDYNRDVRVQTLLRSSTNAAGQPIVYPTNGPAEVSILIVEIPPGKQTGWHRHPVPLFGYVLAGQVTVSFADGRKHTFTEGQPLAESVNLLHNGVNEGKTLTRLLIVVAGTKGAPFTIKSATDKDGRPLGDFPVSSSKHPSPADDATQF